MKHPLLPAPFGLVPLSLALALALALANPAVAQVPDGYVAFGCFGNGTGQGIYFAHPRDPAAIPVAVTNLPANLSSAGTGSRGIASMMRRSSDGALLVGERAPNNASVDLHVLHLSGNQVVFAQLFSCGTSAGAGEIPQFGLLPDGRVVVAATDLLAGGQLAHFFNGAYHWQGLSILDTKSGAFTTVPVSNWNQFVGVMNGMAVSRDGSTIYLGAYISASSGALWEIPVAGGTAVQVAALPFGDSNVAIDQDDTVLLTTLNGPPNFFRYDPVSTTVAVIGSTSGPLNAVCLEQVTGNYFLATANAGSPPRSLIWRTPNGPDNVLLTTPTAATISAVTVNPNPESYGAGTPGGASYRWLTAPNPGGMPEIGNSNFSLTVAADQAMLASGVFVVGFAPSAPIPVFGVEIVVEPSNALLVDATLIDTATFNLPLPPAANLVGIELFAQALWIELPLAQFAASPGISLTIL